MEKYVKMLKELALTVKKYVSKAIDPIKDRLAKVEEKISSIESKEFPIDDIAIKAALLIEKPKDGVDGVDGKSITLDEVKPLINEAVNEAVKQIPRPKDGKNGVDGKDADIVLIKQSVKDEVLACFDKIELPKDGKSIEPEEVKRLILYEVSKLELPQGEKGEKGDRGEKGEQGIQGESGLNGSNGLSAYELAAENGFTGSLNDWLLSLKGKDGAIGEKGADGVNGINGENGVNGKSAFEIAQEKGFNGTELDWLAYLKGEKGIDGKDGRDGRDGKDGLAGSDGENGKDALQIDILPLIDESKTYPRGSYASYNGGLWHAIKNTQGMDGWVCIVDGVKDINVTFDGERTVSVDIVKSSSQVINKSFDMPAMIYKDIYSASNEYKTGDTVTWGGSLWCCLESTTDKPGESKSWRLCAKKGRDGKDGLKGDRGEKGERGDSGRDLTQLGLDGRKW